MSGQAYSTHFPSAWTFEGEDEDEDEGDPIPSQPRTPTPNSQTDTSSDDASFTALVIPTSAASTSPKYFGYFPPSWVLPSSPSTSPSATPPPSRHTFTSSASHSKVANVGLQMTRRPGLRDRRPTGATMIWLGPQNKSVPKQRALTSYTLGSQVAQWQRQNKAQSFSLARERDNVDWVENFGTTLFAQLPRSVLENTLRTELQDQPNEPWAFDIPQNTAWMQWQRDQQDVAAGRVGALCDRDLDYDTVEMKEDSDCYGDVPHRAPAVADAYSTRSTLRIDD